MSSGLLISSISAIHNPPSAEKSIRAENWTFPNASILHFETLPITLLTALSTPLDSTLWSLDTRYSRLLLCNYNFNWIISSWSLTKLLFIFCWDTKSSIRQVTSYVLFTLQIKSDFLHFTNNPPFVSPRKIFWTNLLLGLFGRL